MTFKVLFSLLAVLLCANAVFGVKIISKAQWGGRSATSRSSLASGLSYAVIHHTAGAYCSTQASCSQQMRNIQSYHMDSLGWADIGYNFLIGGDGQVYEGRGWSTMGAHATNWNSKSIGISFMGNYNNDKPTAAQIAAAKGLLADAVSRGQIKSGYILYGHRQVGSTECPGNNLYAEIKKWPNYRA
ncbi:peptidoglycan-recognition protein SC2 [Zeugodacus cucurbitae]|uniref:peptidoglycan-recognition protein SC2 n=1 Tax=Zeugodacus cucurbitae TaxID=28588 RepID=UPI00059687EC|nr:peptidoglycan-recognition protein SC2 [Zeugodacus cucurbitae]